MSNRNYKMHNLLLAILVLVFVILASSVYIEGLNAGPVNKKRVVRLHYTDWCPHCKTMTPVWEAVKKTTNERIPNSFVFEEVNEDVAKTPGVKSYPTIRMITEYGKVVEYSSTPNYENLLRWVISPYPSF
jgi:thiol-disulfide isomerase/thioredoxin